VITVMAVSLLVHTAVLTLRATNQELDDARLLAQRLATTDPLTGAANRRSFTDLVRVLAGQGAEHALCIVDVDNFKLLNDRFGHLVGDDVLRAVARRLAAAVPDGTVARWGGEEFAVLCSPARPYDLGRVAEALRAEVDGDPVLTGVGPIACSVSVGATIWGRSDNFEQALRRADSALYEAKATGRNRWVQHLRDSVAVDDVRRPA
jgi:diguanylate cyclase (GGDEF)-like protein